MNEIWYMLIALFVALSFFVISTMTMPPMEKTIKPSYEVNGTSYSCRKGFSFNKKTLTCVLNER